MSKSGVEYIIELQRRADAMNQLQAYIWLRWPLTRRWRYPKIKYPPKDRTMTIEPTSVVPLTMETIRQAVDRTLGLKWR